MADLRIPKINKVMLCGRIATDLESRTTPAGKQFAKFTVAVDDGYKDTSNKWVDRAYFVRCVIWDKQAETLANNAHKGSAIILEGKITVNQFTDKDGNNRSDTAVVCSYVQVLDKKETADNPVSNPATNDQITDDVPF